MSNFDVETSFRRFVILGVGAVVCIGVVYLIARGSGSMGRESSPQTKSRKAKTGDVAQSSGSTLPGWRKAGGPKAGKQVVEKEPVSATRDSIADPSTGIAPTNIVSTGDGAGTKRRSLRVIFFGNDLTQKMRPQDGAVFPKEHCSVKIKVLESERSAELVGGLGPEVYHRFGRDDSRSFYNGHLLFRECQLRVTGGLLSGTGVLRQPIWLTFQDSSSQPDILIWPTGCTVRFGAECNEDGRVLIAGGQSFLEAFAIATTVDYNPTVRLVLSANMGECVTNVPVSGAEYGLGCLGSNRRKAMDSMQVLQEQTAIVGLFRKLFQLNEIPGASVAFWTELDQHCQVLTQGRIGVVGYDFTGSETERESVRLSVLADLAAATGVTTEAKAIVESTLTAQNLTVMAGLPNRIAWEKGISRITYDLGAQGTKARAAAAPAAPKVAGTIQWSPIGEVGPGQGVVLGQLIFSAGASEQGGRQVQSADEFIGLPLGGSARGTEIDRQVLRLDTQIMEIRRTLSTKRPTASESRRLLDQLAACEKAKQTLLRDKRTGR